MFRKRMLQEEVGAEVAIAISAYALPAAAGRLAKEQISAFPCAAQDHTRLLMRVV